MNDNILILASAATAYAKLIVDVVRLADTPPRWASPVLAILAGILVVMLLQVADGVALVPQQIARAILAGLLARAILAGLLAGGGAVGVTELQRRAS